jgi:hypothetical protein
VEIKERFQMLEQKLKKHFHTVFEDYLKYWDRSPSGPPINDNPDNDPDGDEPMEDEEEEKEPREAH